MLEQLRKVAKLKCTNSENNLDKEKFEMIEKILEDDDCFKKMKTETAYSLLEDLGFNEVDVKKIYNEIIFSSLGF